MEIGSEFYTNSSKCGQNAYFDLSDYEKRYVLSGRTGLYLIAEELKQNFSDILLPEYCCGSMIAPFFHQGFEISFYNAFDLKSVETGQKKQAVLVMDYFGFLSTETVRFVTECKKAGKIVIIDATQTAFSASDAYKLADYIVVSYRKWTDCLCAVVYSKCGFSTPKWQKEYSLYNAVWRKAASLKADYIKTNSGDKQEFLSLYLEANQMLEEKFDGYTASLSEISELRKTDSIFIRETRRNNAEYLLEEISKLSEDFDIKPIFRSLNKEDCPLFVPVLVDSEQRTKIRKHLIENKIYCPIHWPVDERYPNKKTEYHRQELSLICDQRYGIPEMKKEISVLKQAIIMSVPAGKN